MTIAAGVRCRVVVETRGEYTWRGDYGWGGDYRRVEQHLADRLEIEVRVVQRRQVQERAPVALFPMTTAVTPCQHDGLRYGSQRTCTS